MRHETLHKWNLEFKYCSIVYNPPTVDLQTNFYPFHVRFLRPTSAPNGKPCYGNVTTLLASSAQKNNFPFSSNFHFSASQQTQLLFLIYHSHLSSACCSMSRTTLRASQSSTRDIGNSVAIWFEELIADESENPYALRNSFCHSPCTDMK